MEKLLGIKRVKGLLTIISEIAKPTNPELVTENEPASPFKQARIAFRPSGNSFEIKFQFDHRVSMPTDIKLGRDYKGTKIRVKHRILVLENIYTHSFSPPSISGTVDSFHSEGFDSSLDMYYRLLVPLKEELDFYRQIDQTIFDYDIGIGLTSRNSTKARIADDNLEVYIINKGKDKKKEFYLGIDSAIKQPFGEFSKKAFAIMIGLGYLTGHLAGGKGWYFTYESLEKTKPLHFRFMELRGEIRTTYHPINSNAYSYDRASSPSPFDGKLRNISLSEFSLLCEWIYSSKEFSGLILLILESCAASLLFMPGGFAIALEKLSSLMITPDRSTMAPITDPKVSSSLVGKIKALLTDISGLQEENRQVLDARIDALNDITNMTKLKAPFEAKGIMLSREDKKVIKTRNDLLHGRWPDFTKVGENRTTERIDRDLIYVGTRFYTLLNLLILKSIGYDNWIVNYPKLWETTTGILLENEQKFRKV